jgi:DNA-binding NarL/FixJ family response regulator
MATMNKIRVVFIEDHDLTRLSICAGLRQHQGIEVVGHASNASEGLDLLLSSRPDVALVDIGLPDMDGIELTKLFKTSLPLSPSLQTKVLMLTFQNDEAGVLAAFGAGADSYCMKDISFERLVDAIKETYEGNCWIDPAIAHIILKQVRASSHPDQHEIPSRHSIGSGLQCLLDTNPLTERELEVLGLIVEGETNARISEYLYISLGTVKTHVRNILAKLCVDDRTQAAVVALRSGLV